jgi:hypothetical protein
MAARIISVRKARVLINADPEAAVRKNDKSELPLHIACNYIKKKEPQARRRSNTLDI